MKIDVLARRWGGPDGGHDGMAVAAGYLAATLAELGHEVRQLGEPAGWSADLVITTVSPTWRRVAAEAQAQRALSRLVYWHHAGGLPPSFGCTLATPPAVDLSQDWRKIVILPPSSWAAEAGGDCTGQEILVGGAGPAKGGHVALAVARLSPRLRWYVLPGRCSKADLAPWLALGRADVAPGLVPPSTFLARARALLAPTRFDVHPLLLVEAAVRGIPIVCSDLPGTRAAARESAAYLPMAASPDAWADALEKALRTPRPRLRLRPYREVVADALASLVEVPRRAVG